MFELHNDGPCLLCKGAEDHDQFDYCRACGFTLFTFRKQFNHRQEIAALVEEMRRTRDKLWRRNQEYMRDKGNGYDDCVCMIEELLGRSE